MTINDGSISDGLLIGFDRTKNGDNTVLIVGRQDEKTRNVRVLNAFSGEEAYELYKKLVEERKAEETVTKDTAIDDSYIEIGV